MQVFSRIQAAAAAKVALGVGVLALSAQAKFYLGPVPSTLQSYALFVLAAALPARLAVGAVLAYLAAGAAGAPVFANGTAALLGPSGGYLLGFLPAAAIVATCARSGSFARFALGFVAALAAIYACGLAQLAFFVPASELFALGLKPFVLADLLKTAAAAATILPARRFFARF